ncbi:serine hydrolase [Luteimonas aestuarii]|uniref:Serine hydrolase n=2 Tax=Luteimonas aestuarii TaxID=453837 RepID=A0A4V3ALF9_9GAMM|nr:serine hydrolase [Luteimonas aestuarii]
MPLPRMPRRMPTMFLTAPTLLRAGLLALLLAGLPVATFAQTATPPELEGIEASVERGMRDWQIPGLTVSVVKDDAVVWARGFGVRRLGQPAPVDEHTLFNVASVSKAINAAALGILVDEGKLDWDDPVIDHIPGFRLHDPVATTQATVRDLLAHRVGLGRLSGNRIRWISARPRAEQIERLQYLPLEQPFRSGWVYSNELYMVAGELVPATTGMQWEDFVRQRLFAPLGMSRSLAAFAQLQPGENVAMPHQEIDGEVVAIAQRDFDGVAAAASVHGSAVEMARWMRLNLGDTPGTVDGVRILAPETVRELHRAQSLVAHRAHEPLAAYGLGWRLENHRGRTVSQHSGSVDGINSLVYLLPGENLGVFVSANVHTGFTTALARTIVDAYLGVDGEDWHAASFAAYTDRKAKVRAERDAIHAARIPGTRPGGPLSTFAGRYADPLYADAEVRVERGRLVLQLWGDDLQVADLEHWHHDTFRAVWRNRAMREEFVWFTRGRDGGFEQLHIEWNLRPDLLQVGAYPSSYRRVATFLREPSVD